MAPRHGASSFKLRLLYFVSLTRHISGGAVRHSPTMKNLTVVSLAAAATLAASFSPSPLTSFPARNVPALSARSAASGECESDANISNSPGGELSLSPSSSTRRSALKRMVGGAGLASLVLPVLTANADDGDLTSQLFNEDGSLKEGQVLEEAKSRTVASTFPGGSGDSTPGKKALVSVDGVAAASAGEGGSAAVKVSYELPEKWGDASTGYLDKSEGVNAKSADRISVFQLAGPAEVKTLDKATTIGVAKALGIQTLPEYNPSILKADLISGRRSNRDGITYYEYDLAVAPASCASGSKEDLGLGFCPYDSIVLLSAAVVDGRMYGIMVECDRDEWKKGNADLKRVRSSFRVDAELELLNK